jgi:ankyrin repeat protein
MGQPAADQVEVRHPAIDIRYLLMKDQRRKMCSVFTTMRQPVGIGLVFAVSLVLAKGAAAAGGSKNADLAAAARRQDIAAVRTLLQQKADVNGAQPDGATALHWATYRNAADVVDLLLDAGARVNVANVYGVTPLSLACTNRNATIVDRLLRAGANPNTASSTGETPLMTCAYTGSAAAVKALLSHGATVNASEGSHGQTALMWAAGEGHSEVVKLLVEAGADVRARSNVSRHLVCFLVQCGKGAATEYMERGAFTPLLFASRRGDVASARILLDAGGSLEERAADGYSPLMVATHSDHLPLTKFFLERGANPNASGVGYTALHTAVLRGDPALVRLLLDAGADPNVRITKPAPMERFSYGWMVLPEAVVSGTPFYLAAKYVEVEIMRALLAAGADPQLALKDGTTPLMAAAGTGWGIGGSADRRGRTLDIAAVAIELDDEAGTLAAVKLALDAGNDASATNQSGTTAMHGAAAHGYKQVLQSLVDRGGSLDVKDGAGSTPAELMAKFKR